MDRDDEEMRAIWKEVGYSDEDQKKMIPDPFQPPRTDFHVPTKKELQRNADRERRAAEKAQYSDQDQIERLGMTIREAETDLKKSLSEMERNLDLLLNNPGETKRAGYDVEMRVIMLRAVLLKKQNELEAQGLTEEYEQLNERWKQFKEK